MFWFSGNALGFLGCHGRRAPERRSANMVAVSRKQGDPCFCRSVRRSIDLDGLETRLCIGSSTSATRRSGPPGRSASSAPTASGAARSTTWCSPFRPAVTSRVASLDAGTCLELRSPRGGRVVFGAARDLRSRLPSLQLRRISVFGERSETATSPQDRQQRAWRTRSDGWRRKETRIPLPAWVFPASVALCA